jgi:NAD(P)-dependent dehydrogenase (short-subunit alcohol dehydrogenase family)
MARVLIAGASRGIGRGMAAELTDWGVPFAAPRTVLRLGVGFRSIPSASNRQRRRGGKGGRTRDEDAKLRVPHPDRRSADQPGPVCCPVGLVIRCNQA